MSDVIVRRMADRDLEEVATLEKQIFSDPWSYDSFKSDLNNEMALPLVAILDNTVVGYSCLYVVADEMQVGNFAISPDFHKRGFGKLLMNEVVRLALGRKCEFIFLEVRESNGAAQALYGSFGFKTVGRRNNYYRNPVENAIIMVKEL